VDVVTDVALEAFASVGHGTTMGSTANMLPKPLHGSAAVASDDIIGIAPDIGTNLRLNVL